MAYNFTGEIKSSDEGDIFWTEKDGLADMNLASGMGETMRVFLDDNISELAYSPKDTANMDPDWRYEDWTYSLN